MMNLPRPIAFTVNRSKRSKSTNNRSKPAKPVSTPVKTDSTILKIDSLIDAVQSIESPIATRFIEQLAKWRTNTILEFSVLEKKSPTRILDFVTYPVIDGKRVSKYEYYEFSKIEKANGVITIPLGRQGIDANSIVSLVAKRMGITDVPVMHPISISVASVTSSASSRTRFARAIVRERASVLDRIFAATRSIFSSYADASVIQGGERPTPAQLDAWTSTAFSKIKVHADIAPACTTRVKSSATFTPVEPSNHGMGQMRHTLWNLNKAVPKFARETGNARAAAIAAATSDKLKKLDALIILYERTVHAQKTFTQLENSIGDAYSFIKPRVGEWNASGMTNDDAMRTLSGVLEIYKAEINEIVKFLPTKIQKAAIGSVAAAAAAPRPPPPPPPPSTPSAPPPPPPPQPNRVTTINQQVTTARVANAADASAVSKNNARIKRYQDELVRAQRRIQELERNVELRNAKIRKSSQNAKEHRSQTLKKLNTLQDLLDEGGRIMKTFKAKITDQKAELRRIGALLVTEYAKNEKLESRILNRDRKIRRLEMTLKSFVLAGVLAASVPFFMSRNSRAYATLKSRGNASTKKLIAQIQTLPSPSFTPRVNAPRTAAPRVNVPRIAAPRVNVPRIAAPRVNVPRIDAIDMANATYNPNIIHVAGLAAAALGIKSLVSKRIRHAIAVRRERTGEHIPNKNELIARVRTSRSSRSSRSNRSSSRSNRSNRSTRSNDLRERMNEHIPPPSPPSTLQQLHYMYGNQLHKRRW